MTDKPVLEVKDAAKNAARPKPAGNPVFRMMGLPNFRFRLPSRNWLIFLSVTGSFTTAVLYDRYHKKRAQQRWCNIVSHIAKEPMSTTQMPRRITVFLSAPPGDSLRAVREHFHEYVKPVLVAGAMDWDVIEGRREGDVRAGLAEKIRKRRRNAGEKPANHAEGEAPGEDEDLVQQLRDTAGVKDWEGVQGDLVLGRHTWKEYIRGTHEGWLGPLDPPSDPLQAPASLSDPPQPTPEQSFLANDANSESKPGAASMEPTSGPETQAMQAGDPQSPKEEDKAKDAENGKPKEEEKPKTPTQPLPYTSPSAYPSATLPSSIPEALPPSTILPFPHLLGFLNTPIRIYRFLNRRHLADETGRELAALVLARHVRACKVNTDFASSADPDALPTDTARQLADSADVVPTRQRWEQEGILEGEEKDWHKSAWQDRTGEEERVWKDRTVIDPRVGERMRLFELGKDDEERAKKDDGVEPSAKGMWENVKEMVGWEEDSSVKGWEHGLVGEESE
ncbi:MAG: hypothetical protein Q9208_001065 [Pyrenodesmia sp. 3 TL-2023]